MVVMKVTVALLVNVCVDIVNVVGRVVDEDQWLSWSMCVDIFFILSRCQFSFFFVRKSFSGQSMENFQMSMFQYNFAFAQFDDN